MEASESGSTAETKKTVSTTKKAYIALAVVCIALLLIILPKVSPKLVTGPNGCQYLVNCGSVTNDESSENFLSVTRYWKNPDEKKIPWNSDDAPEGDAVVLDSSQKSPVFKHWNGFFVPAGCKATEGKQTYDGGNWYKIDDYKNHKFHVTCDSYGVAQ